MSVITLNIAEEFSKTPGGSTKDKGQFSGEEFFEKLLEPKYKAARAADTVLVVDLDGTRGYPHAFLAYAFGALEVKYPGAKDKIMFVSVFEPYLVEDIRFIFAEAEKQTDE